MQKLLRLVIIVAVIGLGIWGWRVLFPGPERVIRKHLLNLARTASVEPADGTVARGLKAYELPDYFTPDVVITLDIRGYGNHTLTGRTELMERVNPMMQQLRGLKIEFLDINVKLDPSRQTAVANLTGKATAADQGEFLVQEFNFMLRKSGRKWLIYRVESVKTLSLLHPAPGSRAPP